MKDYYDSYAELQHDFAEEISGKRELEFCDHCGCEMRLEWSIYGIMHICEDQNCGHWYYTDLEVNTEMEVEYAYFCENSK